MGGILMLAPNGLDALCTIGADEVARSLGQPIPRMVIANGAGKEFGAFPALTDVPVSRVMWRSDLYRALQDHAVARGVRIQYGKRLQGVDETSDGIVARFTDGTTASADVLIGADDVEHGKPDPEGYVAAARRLGVDRRFCVVFEDTPPGLEAARAAGMRGIGIATTYSRKELGAVDCIEDFYGAGLERSANGVLCLTLARH